MRCLLFRLLFDHRKPSKEHPTNLTCGPKDFLFAGFICVLFWLFVSRYVEQVPASPLVTSSSD